MRASYGIPPPPEGCINGRIRPTRQRKDPYQPGSIYSRTGATVTRAMQTLERPSTPAPRQLALPILPPAPPLPHLQTPIPAPPEGTTSTTLVRREASILSPLRYPGAKRRFAGYVAEALRCNELRPRLFVEPFAGGASVSLRLLQDNLVDQVGLGELDPMVAAFWKCVFFDTDWLVDAIEKVVVSLATWNRYRTSQLESERDQALACIFLNRTSFSGILSKTAGPIGGQQQTSKYKIDCRFTKPTLVKRIRQAAALRDRVAFVHCAAWDDTVTHACSLGHGEDELMYYLDPPFYHKAAELYRHYFSEADHQALHDALIALPQHWLLSYDAAEQIRHMYADALRPPKCVELLYTAASTSQVPVRELVMTNLRRLPVHDRLWRTAAEWGRNGTTNTDPTLTLTLGDHNEER